MKWLEERMKWLEVSFVGLVGAASAIPGMAALQEVEVPGGTEALFDFVLASTSALVVLTAFNLRDKLGSRSVLRISLGGLVTVLVLLFSLIYLINKILVVYTWGGESGTQFVPLLLPSEAQDLLREAGSRTMLLTTQGPEVLVEYTTETGVAVSLIALLFVYTLLVASLAGVFAVLGFRALGGENKLKS